MRAKRLAGGSLLLALLYGVAPAVSAEMARASQILAPGDGMALVAAQCGVCHSLALVAQNRADREGWTELIRWMQAKHGLWPLGEFETPILDYLSAHYAPARVGRRQPLTADLLPQLEVGASSSNGPISH